MRGASLGMGIVASILLLAGCSGVRTYTVDEGRVDQNLAQGNQGYLMGTPKADAAQQERRATRKRYVAEVELGMPYKAKPSSETQGETVVREVVSEPAGETVAEEPAVETAQSAAGAEAAQVTAYTVERNDTLQKISQKVYGTSKKWKVIYEANSDKLKSPDRIYAGQVLKIPR